MRYFMRRCKGSYSPVGPIYQLQNISFYRKIDLPAIRGRSCIDLTDPLY